MSLTSHLRDSSSPIRQFLTQRFPVTESFSRGQNRKLRGAETIRLPSKPPSWIYATLGTAIDYRLRYYFQPSCVRELVA